MLVLSRERNESVIINDNIEVVVVEMRSGAVRLGFTAPKEVPIHRKEVWLQIQAANKSKCSHEFPVNACPHSDCTHYKGDSGDTTNKATTA